MNETKKSIAKRVIPKKICANQIDGILFGFKGLTRGGRARLSAQAQGHPTKFTGKNRESLQSRVSGGGL
jgi:hypothetical protein